MDALCLVFACLDEDIFQYKVALHQVSDQQQLHLQELLQPKRKPKQNHPSGELQNLLSIPPRLLRNDMTLTKYYIVGQLENYLRSRQMRHSVV